MCICVYVYMCTYICTYMFFLPAIIALRTNAGQIMKHAMIPEGRLELSDHATLHVSQSYIISPEKGSVDTEQKLGHAKEHASQEGERSTIGVERARPTSVDTQMQHIWSQLLANSSGMQKQTLQNDCYVVTYCKSPLSLEPIS